MLAHRVRRRRHSAPALALDMRRLDRKPFDRQAILIRSGDTLRLWSSPAARILAGKSEVGRPRRRCVNERGNLRRGNTVTPQPQPPEAMLGLDQEYEICALSWRRPALQRRITGSSFAAIPRLRHCASLAVKNGDHALALDSVPPSPATIG